MPREGDRVAGRCPMGCGETLTLGSGGHVTCSLIGCPNPTAADELLHLGSMPSQGFAAGFTLAELTLIQQGLWSIGRHQAVDERLLVYYEELQARLRPAIMAAVAEASAGA